VDSTILISAALNGLLVGGIYTLVASGLTLIYGVLHIINFAHGSLLMMGMFGVYYLLIKLRLDPYISMLIMVPAMYAIGYVLYKGLIGRFSSGKDENILLITLGLSIVLENLALMFFKGDTRTITVGYSDTMVELGPLLFSLPSRKAIRARPFAQSRRNEWGRGWWGSMWTGSSRFPMALEWPRLGQQPVY